MSQTTSSKVQSVSEWLTIATHGLVPAARERIKLEIEAHYADLVAARLAKGMTTEDAESAALQELGAPANSATEFRKQHLTEDEERYLENWVEKSRESVGLGWYLEVFVLLFVVLHLVWLIELQFKVPAVEWVGLGWSIFVLISCTIINVKLGNSLKQKLVARDFVRKFLKLQMWNRNLTVSVLLTSWMIGSHPVTTACANAVIVILNVTSALSKQRALLRKLDKHGAPDSFVFAGK